MKQCVQLFVLALCLVFQANAQSVQETFVKIEGKKFPADVLTEVVSPVVNMDEFARIAGRTLREYTQNTGFEACAMICEGEKGFGVAPISVRSHSGCPVTPLCPEGMSLTNQSIHSHPTIEYFALQEIDKIVLNEHYRRVGAKTKNPPPSQFSEQDYKSPGYMVDGSNLYHQNGKTNVRNLGPL